MKNFFKLLSLTLMSVFVMAGFISCGGEAGDNEEITGSNIVFDSRVKGLDTIFGTDKLGETKITIKRSEWNTLLSNYDKNPKNETCVHADYAFVKGDYDWSIKDVGIRIRGNTSRRRPQLADGSYQQAHFKVDFEEFPIIVDGEEQERDEKMGGVMKGVILKRCKDDGTYIREVFCYNYFRECGVWTSPRAGYTRLLLDIEEEDGSVEKVDFGVYEMIENTDKQFLKARTAEEKGGDFNGNKGNLWKCTWKSGNGPKFTTDYDDSDFGVEDVPLEGPASEFSYDLKTNKDKLSKAKKEIQDFISELNALNDSDPKSIKAWYDSKMDMKLFLKTYAINVILGMWDDYWVNQNNYYFYFDKDGKAYFIPYDYDNTLGTNGCDVDAAYQNPLEWGSLNDGSKPLIQKAMKVPEYVELYKKYLLQYSGKSSGFDYSNASKKINKWQSMISNYIAADKYTGECKLAWEDTTYKFEDKPANWGTPYYPYKLLSDGEDNYFRIRQQEIKEAINPSSN